MDLSADRSPELPEASELATLIAAVERIGPVRVRNAGRSAFNHLRKSWILHPIDSEMSYFRSLTAEEEASTALILALKQQRYPGANRLNAFDHVHKAAVWAIIEALGRGHLAKGLPIPVISVAKEGRPRITLNVDVAPLTGSDEPLWMQPVDPFHLVIHSDEKGEFEVHRWQRELAQMAGESSSIEEYIRSEANKRNVILYASDKGIPAVRFGDELILERLERVKWIMVVAIGVLQTKNLQLLVQQALEALLIAVRRFEGTGFDFPAYVDPEIK